MNYNDKIKQLNKIYKNNILLYCLDINEEKHFWLDKYLPLNLDEIDKYIYCIQNYSNLIKKISNDKNNFKKLKSFYCSLKNENKKIMFEIETKEKSQIMFKSSFLNDIDVKNRYLNLNESSKLALEYLKKYTKKENKIFILRDFEAARKSVLIECENGKNFGYGRSNSFQNAKNIALLEYIERCNSRELNYDYKQNTIFGSYNKLKEKYNLLNPVNLILPNNTKYNSDFNLTWIKCENICLNTSIYVPLQEMIYGFEESSQNHKNNILYSTSNGASLSSLYYESVYYGILEVIERHNFLYHWFEDITPKKINWKELKNFELKKEIYTTEIQKNLKVTFFLFEKGIKIKEYSVGCIVQGSTPLNQTYSAGSTNKNLYKAMETAYNEAIVGISLAKNWNMNDFNENIVKSEDHIIWHLRNKSTRLQKWLKSKHYVNLKQLDISEISVKEHLVSLLEFFTNNNYNIITLNLTNKTQEKYNLFISKTIIPGLIPITFGIKNNRTTVNSDFFEPHPFP